MKPAWSNRVEHHEANYRNRPILSNGRRGEQHCQCGRHPAGNQRAGPGRGRSGLGHRRLPGLVQGQSRSTAGELHLGGRPALPCARSNARLNGADLVSDNYPDEGFYSLTNATLSTANAGKALLVVALEQAFRSGPVVPGDQITFARLRLKVTNAQDGVDYKFTTPAGVKTLQTGGKVPGLLFDTEDIGIGGPGDFTGALGGRVGPFLTWDTYPNDTALKPDASGQDTYIGDGATLHKITGSPYGAANNVFRIE
ncbi:MAG: hypothetical protein QOD31_2569, partial [Pseudonocardiales bacterium]|nr:hypothetical protein [Pseudonocardiales bacterium]